MRETGIDSWRIVLLEKFPCADKEELTKQEDAWMAKFPKKRLNKNAAMYNASCHTKSRVQIKTANSVRYECKCGSKVWTGQKQRHYRSKKHKKWATENNVPIPVGRKCSEAVSTPCQCGGRYQKQFRNVHAQTGIHKKWLATCKPCRVSERQRNEPRERSDQ